MFGIICQYFAVFNNTSYFCLHTHTHTHTHIMEILQKLKTNNKAKELEIMQNKINIMTSGTTLTLNKTVRCSSSATSAALTDLVAASDDILNIGSKASTSATVANPILPTCDIEAVECDNNETFVDSKFYKKKYEALMIKYVQMQKEKESLVTLNIKYQELLFEKAPWKPSELYFIYSYSIMYLLKEKN